MMTFTLVKENEKEVVYKLDAEGDKAIATVDKATREVQIEGIVRGLFSPAWVRRFFKNMDNIDSAPKEFYYGFG